jgi:predicted Ser/Thr protein kinase
MKNREALQAILKECRTHAEVLQEAKEELGDARFDENTVTRISIQQRRLLDQLAYRFSKLQDSMGMKLLPMLLDLAEEPLSEDATFAEKLQRLERLGALESVEGWRQLREIRNQIAHEYEDAPALKAAVLNRFIEEIDALLAIWKKAEVFSAK